MSILFSLFSFLPGVYLRVKLLGDTIILCFIYWETTRLFSTVPLLHSYQKSTGVLVPPNSHAIFWVLNTLFIIMAILAGKDLMAVLRNLLRQFLTRTILSVHQYNEIYRNQLVSQINISRYHMSNRGEQKTKVGRLDGNCSPGSR